MKALLYKEIRLGIHPSQYLFLAFAAMLLIPQYPYYVAFLYCCLGVYFTFLRGRENRDVYYTALLPVSKADMVRARVLAMLGVQGVQLLLSIPVAILSLHCNPMGQNAAGIEPNPAFFGLTMGMLGGFNLLFLPTFYKTAERLGGALLWGGIFIGVYIFLAEALAQYIPGPISTYLDARDPVGMAAQWPVTAAGLVVWLGASALACRMSIRRFERVDL